MKKFLIPLFAVAIVATGCSKSGKNTVPDGPQPIKLGAGVKTRTSVESDGSGVITSPTSLTGVGFLRADNRTAADWKTAAIVDQTTASAGTGPGRIAATLTAASGNNTVTFAPLQYYHGAPTMNAYLRGYHPNSAELTKNASEFVEAKWVIDGKMDVMLSDYVSGNKATPGAAAIPVSFEHVLSKLTIKVVAENDGAKASWGDVTSMTIKGVPTNIVAVFDGEVADQYKATALTTPTADIAVWGYDAATKSTTDAAPDQLPLPVGGESDGLIFGQTMVYPAASYMITVNTVNHAGGTDSTTIPIDNEAQPGMNHVITLTFKASGITATATVQGWQDSNDGGSGSIQ